MSNGIPVGISETARDETLLMITREAAAITDAMAMMDMVEIHAAQLRIVGGIIATVSNREDGARMQAAAERMQRESRVVREILDDLIALSPVLTN